MLNGLQNLTDKIQSDAKGYADELAEATRKKVDDLLREQKDEADELRANMTETARKEAEGILARANSQAALEERNALLRAKRDMINETFELAAGEIASLPKKKYIALLAKLVKKYQTGPAEIILNARDLKEVGAELLNEILSGAGAPLASLCQQPGSFKGGLILRQGDVDTNCTVEVLCEGMRHELEPKVIELLQF
ncbi:MAG: hypothetical protein HFG26_09575 [Provencibacterium sp.]|jgi:V/A-type H+-transporting ATPase subunit E|nr:hypothetical protein [Provencibacterium sp.]